MKNHNIFTKDAQKIKQFFSNKGIQITDADCEAFYFETIKILSENELEDIISVLSDLDELDKIVNKNEDYSSPLPDESNSFEYATVLSELNTTVAKITLEAEGAKDFDKESLYPNYLKILRLVLKLAIETLPLMKQCSYSQDTIIEALTYTGVESMSFLLGQNSMQTYILGINRISAYATLAIEVPDNEDGTVTDPQDLKNILNALGLITSIAQYCFKKSTDDLLSDLNSFVNQD